MDENAKFESFLEAHAAHARAFRYLEQNSKVLGRSARTVFAMHGKRLGRIQGEILGFLESAGIPNYIEKYIVRVNGLIAMQERFNNNPSQETLCDASVKIERESYDIALFLSIIFSNHRFEIISQYKSYLDMVQRPAGKIVSVGMGTGYELKLTVDRLRDWTVEGYDLDAGARRTARRLLEHFQVERLPTFGELFPLEKPVPEMFDRYDGIVLCELLEHLPDPLAAMRACREYLKGDGYMFVTMAVNIAQEDHIYLYPSIQSCRDQIREAGLNILHEHIAPITLLPLEGAAREEDFTSGNYIATVNKG